MLFVGIKLQHKRKEKCLNTQERKQPTSICLGGIGQRSKPRQMSERIMPNHWATIMFSIGCLLTLGQKARHVSILLPKNTAHIHINMGGSPLAICMFDHIFKLFRSIQTYRSRVVEQKKIWSRVSCAVLNYLSYFELISLAFLKINSLFG